MAQCQTSHEIVHYDLSQKSLACSNLLLTPAVSACKFPSLSASSDQNASTAILMTSRRYSSVFIHIMQACLLVITHSSDSVFLLSTTGTYYQGWLRKITPILLADNSEVHAQISYAYESETNEDCLRKDVSIINVLGTITAAAFCGMFI